MRSLNFFITFSLVHVTTSCGVSEGQVFRKEEFVDLQTDSFSNMLKFVEEIDSSHLVENFTHNFTTLKEENEKLETELVETKHELEVVEQKLEVAEKLIEVYVPADTVSSDFKLLPISKANSN